MKKKALILAAALAGTAAHAQSPQPLQPDSFDKNLSAPQPKTNSEVGNKVNKTTIIESLKAIRKDPTTVKFHSAMCYDMAMPAPDTSFSCPNCGISTSYQTFSFAGKVADWMPSVKRIIKNSAASMSVDFSDFCSKCKTSQGAAPELKFVTQCIDCGKQFDWSVKNETELEQLSLLALKYPIKEVDQGEKGSQLIAPEKLAEYIAKRFLCTDCRQKNGLEE